jgi:hypothetical protein
MKLQVKAVVVLIFSHTVRTYISFAFQRKEKLNIEKGCVFSIKFSNFYRKSSYTCLKNIFFNCIQKEQKISFGFNLPLAELF